MANSDHMAEEERSALADFRRQVSLQTRHRIAVDFVTYECEHVQGVRVVDNDPEAYLQQPDRYAGRRS